MEADVSELLTVIGDVVVAGLTRRVREFVALADEKPLPPVASNLAVIPVYSLAASPEEVLQEAVLAERVKWQSSVPAELKVTVPCAPAGSPDSASVAVEP